VVSIKLDMHAEQTNILTLTSSTSKRDRTFLSKAPNEENMCQI